MKIRLAKYKDRQKFLIIEKRYRRNKPVISLGCDCHPAYVLKALNLRTLNYPFDWLSTTPSKGMDYVNKNIEERFKFFSTNLEKNKSGDVISNNYPDAQFLHCPGLIDNQKLQREIHKNSRRFIDYFNNKKCLFLFNVTSAGLESSRDVSFFLDSIKEFHELSNGFHSLHIYIRYDESFAENETNCEFVEKELRKLKRTSVVKYIRYRSEYGIWGNKDSYCDLLTSLGVLKLDFPKIRLSTE